MIYISESIVEKRKRAKRWKKQNKNIKYNIHKHAITILKQTERERDWVWVGERKMCKT